MPRSLLFDEDGVPQEIISDYPEQVPDDNLLWINVGIEDDIRDILPDIVDKSRPFTEDLLEEQRPRIAINRTLEENEETFTVIVLSIPTSKIFTDDDFLLQVTFLLLGNILYSIRSRETGLFPEIMAKVLTKKNQHTISSLFAFILSELFEMSIRVLNELEDHIDYLQLKQLRGGLERGWLASLLTLKSRLFDAHKMIRADAEHLKEIKAEEVPELEGGEIFEHSEDRLLYLSDYVETLREELSNLINLNLAIASNIMNRQFYWLTIIGALLVVPSIIAGLFGMNVILPDFTFWEIVGITFILTIGFFLIVRLLLPRPPIG